MLHGALNLRLCVPSQVRGAVEVGCELDCVLEGFHCSSMQRVCPGSGLLHAVFHAVHFITPLSLLHRTPTPSCPHGALGESRFTQGATRVAQTVRAKASRARLECHLQGRDGLSSLPRRWLYIASISRQTLLGQERAAAAGMGSVFLFCSC
jgi:hypothetical protein